MSVGTNLAASALANAWIALVQIAFVPVYIALLGVEAYGLIGVYAFLQVSLAVLDMGLSPALGREVARAGATGGDFEAARRLLRSVEWAFAVVAAIIVVSIAAASPWLVSHWLRVESLSPGSAQGALMLSAGLMGARLFIGAYRGVIAGAQRLAWLGAVGSAFATLRGAGVIPILWVAPTIEAFFTFQLAVTVVEAFAMSWGAWRLLPSRASAPFALEALRRVGRFSGGATLIAILLLALTQADKVFLSALLPLAAFGHYALASSVAGTLALLTAPVSSVAYPRLNELAAREDAAAFAGAFHGFAQLVSIAVAPAACVLMLFAREILALWTGDPQVTNGAAPLLGPLSAGALLYAFTSMPFLLPMVRGTPGVLARVYGVLLVAFVPALAFWVPLQGAAAAAWTWVGLNAAGVVASFALVSSGLSAPEARRWLLRDVALPGLAAFAGAVAVRWSVSGTSITAFWAIGLACIVAFGAAVACVPLARSGLARGPQVLDSVTTFTNWRQ